jgi:predicted nucleic acid-binding protein
VVEEASESAAEIWGGGLPAASSVVAYPEGRAALAAARRGGRLAARRYPGALAEFEAVTNELISIEVDERLARHAGEQAEAHGLRGYDSVHLATALELSDEVTMVTWDSELRAAAERVGLPVAAADA